MTGQKKKNSVEDIGKMLDRLNKELTPEQRHQLEQVGVVIPAGDMEKVMKGEFELGYRCKHCNEIGLYFAGDEWENGAQLELADGQMRSVPPLHVSIDKIAWTQKGKSAGEIDRQNPCCQHCSHRLVLGPMRVHMSRSHFVALIPLEKRHFA